MRAWRGRRKADVCGEEDYKKEGLSPSLMEISLVS